MLVLSTAGHSWPVASVSALVVPFAGTKYADATANASTFNVYLHQGYSD